MPDKVTIEANPRIAELRRLGHKIAVSTRDSVLDDCVWYRCRVCGDQFLLRSEPNHRGEWPVPIDFPCAGAED